MWYSEWHVLVVDDEPDVLQLSKLVMKSIEVDGVPVRVHTASSKQEAITLLQEQFSEESGIGTLAVAFIDVVMENDQAGLELCDFIRNTMNNTITQLYIRTGQPGTAPERDVIDKYNISGYFTKVEATEDKLYTLVKSGIRQYLFAEYAMTTMMMTNGVIAASTGGQAAITQMMHDALSQQATNRESEHATLCIMADDETVVEVNLTQAEATRIVQDMEANDQFRTVGDGIEYGTSPNMTALKVAATPYSPGVLFVAGLSSMPLNDMMVVLQANAMRSIGTLWTQAAKQVPQGA